MHHPEAAGKFNRDKAHVDWHDKALWFVRKKRDIAASKIAEWEKLRNAASHIKANVLANLDRYLLEFEKNALANGVKVHWAADANEHNAIVHTILESNNATKVVKSKSMLTEECHLNPFLDKRGIEVIDTDLGERIVQLANEQPSHIVLPAIHKTKEDVDEIFQQHLHTKNSGGDVEYLTHEARKHLRQKFIEADAAITGVNFAIAETGGIVICTNEGNADMGINLPPIHIASMGIEKIIPKTEHLAIFLRLLARSATGQPITSYSSHIHKPRKGTELHIILVDNGRSMQLGREEFRSSLHCIRCGACMNTCPVYRRSGGHSYGTTIPGPIGSVLSPGIDLMKHKSLPFASTLCGSCSDVCPVKINLHTLLYRWRQVIINSGMVSLRKRWIAQTVKFVFENPSHYLRLVKWSNLIMKILPGFLINNRFHTWGKNRDLPKPAKHSFQEWYKKNRG